VREAVIMDGRGVAEALDRISRELLERFGDAAGLGLIGIRTRGEFLARRLGVALERALATPVAMGALDITVHRDDFDALQEEIRVRGSQIDFDPRGRPIVLVDDVLYTGRSVRAAIDAVMGLGRPSVIALAVLIDRGHRELPIRADFVGREVVTTRDEEVRVQLEEVDGVDRVLLVGKAA
jgi:pyrimidine operon attenuation protein/uracil phosphoribosyltransferase